MVRFLYPLVIGGGVVLLVAAELVRRWWFKEPTYLYPFVHILRKEGVGSAPSFSVQRLALWLRWVALVMLLLGTARPQLLDESSRIFVEGRDIQLVLDVSGSMQLFDDLKDRRSRFDVAKQELLRFVGKREDDSLGVIIFGAMAFSRCPLTQDKKLLKDIVDSIELGIVNPDGTVLSAALALAIGRLRTSPAKSKIVILLTDGAPSPEDISPEPVIALAKKCGVKVYTIGVGSEGGGFIDSPLQGVIRLNTARNDALLQHIADETGGLFFKAERPEDVARVYESIDALEKTSYELPQYTRFVELFPVFLLVALALLTVELCMRWWWVIP
ncbi:TPA: hypothetical protein DDZ86_05240 [Candidatus Dependentiae bacterium]|nr:hypothetical protein [Candidatus Dependentiae bacterium]